VAGAAYANGMLARRSLHVLSASCVIWLASLGAGVAKAPAPLPTIVPTPAVTVEATPEPEGSPSEAPSAAPSPLPRASSNPEPSPTPGGAGARPPTSTSAIGSLAASLAAARSAPPAAYASFVRGAQRQPGVIDLIQKDDELFFDLPEAALGKTYLIAPVLASSVASEPAAFTGRVYDPLVIRFQRVGRRILWVVPNENYSAPAGSAAANSLAISVADSVVNSTPVVAEDAVAKRVVISAGFFLSDVENVGRDLGGRPSPLLLIFGGASRPGYALDAARSYFERVKALPENDEILASLVFAGQGPEQPAVADSRSIRVRMHYSIVEAPGLGGYEPRLADDRVGYFVQTVKRLGDERVSPPFVRYIDRRDLKKGPIVYTLTNEIPQQYRATVRSAILAWNDAFARAGHPNAIVVRDAPADASFDPDDVRVTAIRWVTGENSSRVAFGPSLTDPRTGEIVRGEVVIDGEAIAAFRRGYGATALPLRESLATALDDDVSAAALGSLALQSSGASGAARDAYVRAYLRLVVMHEVGHTLGLAHNFAASGLYSLARLHDPAFTAHHELTSSVMDYAPVNLSPRGKPQGAYFQDQIGLYDRWAIRYGYTSLPYATPDGELSALRTIARESTRPEYDYESDADASGPEAIDPRVNAFDLSNDPLAYARNQFAIDDDLLARLDAFLPREDRSYADERAAFQTEIRDFARAAGIAGKYVGGAYVSRDHRGQPGGRPPLREIPRAVSYRAFTLLDRYVLSSRALPLSPKLLADLGYDRFGGWGDAASRPDYPATELLAALQDSVLIDRLLSPVTASRIEEASYRSAHPRDVMSLADLFAWMQGAVFDDLHGAAATGVVHRGLQRRYTGYLIELALAPSHIIEEVGYPGDVPALARHNLQLAAASLATSLRAPGLDDLTRAHRGDLLARIRRALAPTSIGAP